jgi:hypothetical protein
MTARSRAMTEADRVARDSGNHRAGARNAATGSNGNSRNRGEDQQDRDFIATTLAAACARGTRIRDKLGHIPDIASGPELARIEIPAQRPLVARGFL